MPFVPVIHRLGAEDKSINLSISPTPYLKQTEHTHRNDHCAAPRGKGTWNVVVQDLFSVHKSDSIHCQTCFGNPLKPVQNSSMVMMPRLCAAYSKTLQCADDDTLACEHICSPKTRARQQRAPKEPHLSSAAFKPTRPG